MKNLFILTALIAVFLHSCSSENSSTNHYSGPLVPFFKTWDELNAGEYNLEKINEDYYLIVGHNNKAEIDKKLKEFEVAHAQLIKLFSKKYPPGSVKLKFEQADKQALEVKDIVLSEYFFPWNTALRLAYKVKFTCVRNNEDPASTVRFEFYDGEGDIISSSSCFVKETGEYEFEIRPEIEFFHFEKIQVSVL